MTLARDENEHRALVAALSHLSQHGIPIAVADGGSTPGFVDDVRRLPNCSVVTGEKGLVAQVKSAIRVARSARRRFVLYTEPDKESFFRLALDGFIADAGDDGAVVIAARAAGALATFPPIQQYTENVVSTLCAQLTGRDGDYCYGPFLVSDQLASWVERADESLGWGWRPFMFVVAWRLGVELRHSPGDFRCPPEQRSADETLHRLRQLSQNIDGIVAGAVAPLG